MDFVKTTEQESKYHHLEKMSTSELLINMNNEDKTVPLAVEKAIPQIEKLVDDASDKLLSGGRLFYIGSGTSGRLGIVDASECPPTFGVPHDLVIGIISGGDGAIRNAVEKAEDSKDQAWKDLQEFQINKKDLVIGIASSGTTPYVVSGLEKCQQNGIKTSCITCNASSPVTKVSDYPIEVVVGPEFLTGSTRLKSGTAQKLVLNMISTSVMIKFGRVKDNRMINMQLSNDKLVERGTLMVMEQCGITDKEHAKKLLLEKGSVKKVMDFLQTQKNEKQEQQ